MPSYFGGHLLNIPGVNFSDELRNIQEVKVEKEK